MKAPDFYDEVIEIRFKPSGKILDRKGYYADYLKDKTGLDHWGIGEGGIEVKNTEETKKITLTHKNLIYYSSIWNSISFFPDQAIKAFSFLFEDSTFKNDIIIERIGLKLRLGYKVDMGYESLLKEFLEKVVVVNPKILNPLGSKIYDIAIPFNYKLEDRNIYTNTGPMKLSQIIKKLTNSHEFENDDTFLYSESDCWKLYGSKLSIKELALIIKEFRQINVKFVQELASAIIPGIMS